MALSSHDFTIVWVDANNSQSDVFFDRSSTLTSIINDLKIFDNTNDCFDFIQSLHDETRIFLIISGQLGEQATTDLYDHSMICYVYVYCSDREKHELWARQYQKIRGVYIDRETLLKQLTIDVTLHSKALTAPITLFKRDELTKKETSMRNLSKECALFMWHQLLFETLLQSNQTSKARHEMLCECKQHYNNNKIELDKIIEFETNFSHDLAIRWYTRDCFLYRLLNKSMRTQNINEIYKYRSFILDLHEQLGILHQSMKSPEIMQVYRGQLMKFEELEQMRANINGLISLNTYFSTSTKAEVASNFCGGGLGRPTFQSVIFTINIKSNVTTKPFANIQEFSYMHDEGEVLFSAGTVFRINDVSEFNEGIWSTELELSSDVQEELDDVMQYMRMQIAERPTLATFGNFLAEMGDLEKAEQYYSLLMHELENENDAGAVLTGIAGVHYRKGDYNTAREYCNKGLEQLTALPSIHPDLATAYNLMGTIHSELDRRNDAIEYYKQALLVHRITLPLDDPLIASDLNNIAVVYHQTGCFDLAQSYFEQSLKIKLAVLPANHPHISHTYVNMGQLQAKQSNWTAALEFYEKALEAQCKILPDTHPDLAITYVSKGLVLAEQHKLDDALQLYEKALSIQLKMIPLNSDHLSTIYEHIAKIYMRRNENTRALHSLEKALQYEIASHGLCKNIIRLHNSIGTVHFRAGDYQTALKMYKSALDFISSDDRGMSHFGILNNIATIHFNSGEYEMALEYYKQVINAVVFTDTSPTNATLVLIYQNVGLSYLATDNYDLAIDYFTHVLKLTNDATILAKTHSNVANALVSKKEFATALQNYELALKYYSSDSEGLVDTYNSIGLVHHYAGDFENAVLSFHQALAVQLATSPDDHAQLATIYNNLAKACCEVGDLDQAMIYFRKQLDLETDQDIRRQVEMNIRSVEQNL